MAAPFDLEAAIREFAASDGGSVLQLPRLSTGQRRHARRVVAECPGLSCESAGAGPDRRLVLRRAAAEAEKELEADIGEFAADPARESWALPRLSTGRRREARRVVERFPGLRCESFGFGEDRRLHLLKTTPPEPPPPTLLLPCKSAAPPPAAGDCGSDTSTCASSLRSSAGSPQSGRYTPLPEGLEVRNTFICSVEDGEGGDRAVRSMPAGMFHRRLLEELEDLRRPGDAWPSTQEPSPDGDADLAPGAEVEICGLTRCPAFNGARGVIHAFDAAAGRYDVMLSGDSGQRWAKVRAENLRAARAPSPRRRAAESGALC